MRVALIEEGGVGEGGRGKYIEEGDGGEYCGRKRVGRAVGGVDEADRPIEGEGDEATR